MSNRTPEQRRRNVKQSLERKQTYKAAPIKSIDMGLINGKPLIIETITVRKTNDIGRNLHLAKGDEGTSYYQTISLPRIAWLERPEI